MTHEESAPLDTTTIIGVDSSHEAGHLSRLDMPTLRPSMGPTHDQSTQTLPQLQKPLLANQTTGRKDIRLPRQTKRRGPMNQIRTSGFSPSDEAKFQAVGIGLGGEQEHRLLINKDWIVMERCESGRFGRSRKPCMSMKSLVFLHNFPGFLAEGGQQWSVFAAMGPDWVEGKEG